MCGIIGLFGGDLDRLAYASSLLAHRGPDDAGLFFDRKGGAALGHRRLAILDTSSRGHQPMATPDGKVVLVYNGEIYNFRELRADLEDEGFVFRGESDTEVLLKLYIFSQCKLDTKFQCTIMTAVYSLHQSSRYRYPQ